MIRIPALLLLATTFLLGCEKKKDIFIVSGYLYSKNDSTPLANTGFVMHNVRKKKSALAIRKSEEQATAFTTQEDGYFIVSVYLISNADLSICLPDYTKSSSCFYDVSIAGHKENKIFVDTVFVN